MDILNSDVWELSISDLSEYTLFQIKNIFYHLQKSLPLVITCTHQEGHHCIQ